MSIKVYSGETLKRLARFPFAGVPRGSSELDATFPIRVLQVLGLSPGGALPISSVSHDATLTGSGTVASPLGVVGGNIATIPGTGKILSSFNANNNGFGSGATYTLNNPNLYDATDKSASIIAAGQLVALLCATGISGHSAGTAPAGFTVFDNGVATSIVFDAFAAYVADSAASSIQTTTTYAFGYSTASFFNGGILAMYGIATAPDSTCFSKAFTSTGQGSMAVPAPANVGTTSSIVFVWGAGGTGVTGFDSNSGIYTLWNSSSNKYSAGFYQGPAVSKNFGFAGNSQSVVACQLVIP